MPRTRRPAAMGVVVALLGLAAVTAGAAPAQDPCPSPHSPVAFVGTPPSTQATTTLPDVGGTDVLELGIDTAPPDSDGDGVPDTVEPKSVVTDPSALTRGDGTLTFVRPGLVVGSPSNGGDLDGDGRDEILLAVFEDGPGPRDPVELWIVPGTTGPGTVDVAADGIRLPTGIGASLADRDGDGTGEVLVQRGGDLVILSGAEIAAVGAPGDARDLTPLLEAPGTYLGQAALASGPPSVVTISETGAEAVITLTDDDGTRAFTTAPEQLYAATTGPGQVQVLVGEAGRFIRLDRSSRSGSGSYLWSIDDPCGDLGGSPSSSPPSASDPASPASPAPVGAVAVPGDARYTG